VSEEEADCVFVAVFPFACALLELCVSVLGLGPAPGVPGTALPCKGNVAWAIRHCLHRYVPPFLCAQ